MIAELKQFDDRILNKPKTNCKGNHDDKFPTCCSCGGGVDFSSESETYDYSDDDYDPFITHFTCYDCLEEIRHEARLDRIAVAAKEKKISDIIDTISEVDYEYPLKVEMALDIGLDGRASFEDVLEQLKIRNKNIKCPECGKKIKLSEVFNHLYTPTDINHADYFTQGDEEFAEFFRSIGY